MIGRAVVAFGFYPICKPFGKGNASRFPDRPARRESWGMSLPTTAQGIYDLLAGDAVISAALGTYTPRGQSPVPAIAVVRRNEQLPEGVAVAGLEVVILANPDYGTVPYLTGETGLNPQFRLYVSEWSALQVAPQAITNAALASGTATLTFAAAHGIGVGKQVAVSGLPAPFAALNGTFTVTAATTASPFTLSYALAGSTIASAAVAAGVMTPSPATSLLALPALTQRIISLLPGCRAVPISGDAPGQGLGVLDQYVISWTNPTQYVVTPES